MSALNAGKKGECALCRQRRALCDSHLVPAAILRLLRDADFRNPNPYIMSLNHIGQSSAQAKQQLLCSNCEQRFSRDGEKWVAANCSLLHKNTFPLRDLIHGAQPLLSGPQGAVYDASKIPKIDIKQLVYFGTSVIWRAAVTSWRLQREVRQPINIAQASQEELRLYLLGGAFPQNATLTVFIISGIEPLPVALFPEILDEDSARVTYRFYIPGIWFLLLLGKGITNDDRKMCILRSPSHPICLSTCADALPGQISYELYTHKKTL